MTQTTNNVENISADIAGCLANHEEALIITANRNKDLPIDSDISVYTKFQDKDSVLTTVLANILQNLLTNIKHNGSNRPKMET